MNKAQNKKQQNGVFVVFTQERWLQWGKETSKLQLESLKHIPDFIPISSQIRSAEPKDWGLMLMRMKYQVLHKISLFSSLLQPGEIISHLQLFFHSHRKYYILQSMYSTVTFIFHKKTSNKNGYTVHSRAQTGHYNKT